MMHESRLSQCIQAVACVLVVCAVLLTFTAYTVSGKVVDREGKGASQVKILLYNGSSSEVKDTTFSGDGGEYSFDGLREGIYRLRADGFEEFFRAVVPGPAVNIILPIVIDNPTVTPEPAHTYTQVKYAQKSYNMAPVIQMNLSWKRASKLEPVAFDSGSTYDPDGFIVAYEWYFGDGSMAEGKAVQHSYKEEGRYSVKLRVVDNGGSDRTAYVTAIISNKPPVSDPGNDTNATVGETVWFNGSGSYDPDGKVVKYEWSFGDGATAQGISVSHAYGRPDKYKAELKVTDDSDANTTAYRTVGVEAPPATPLPAKSGGAQGIVVLAGAGIAGLALVILMRKKG